MNIASTISKQFKAELRPLCSKQLPFHTPTNFNGGQNTGRDVVNVSIIKCNAVWAAWMRRSIEQVELQKPANNIFSEFLLEIIYIDL